MRHARLPARVREEDSETPYMTNRAMDFIREAADQPWCLHLSYIKPHWPYIAPAPYHEVYHPEHVLPANRTASERDDPHPVYGAYMNLKEGRSFSEEKCRQTVIPTYMGLIKQIDDHIGRLMDFLKHEGRLDDTLIILTSDHGDYLGDHWLGDKELFHEESVRIPLIIVDPSAEANTTRGRGYDALVESIDLIPTFIDLLGGEIPNHILEGCSLKPFLHGEPVSRWRQAVFSEMDYSQRSIRTILELNPQEARSFMVRTEDWKLVEYLQFRPQLYNLKDDPHEHHDLGADPGYARHRNELRGLLTDWSLRRKNRLSLSDAQVEAQTGKNVEKGVLIGVW
jgi:arylsulfatase A-like enzyme